MRNPASLSLARACAFVVIALGACAPPASSPPTSAPNPVSPAAAVPKAALLKREINGGSFAYEAYGEGVPIVFLHGNPTDHRSMVPRFEPVFTPASKWRRIYPDLPGLGATAGRAGITTLDAYVDEIAAFIDAETGGKRVALVGTSWGAYLALAYTQKHREKVAGFTLIAPTFASKPTVPHPEPRALVKEPGVFDGEDPGVAGMMTNAATVHSRANRDVMKRDVLPGRKLADEAFLDRIQSTRLSYHDDVRKLQFDGPVLVLTGKQDAICGWFDAREFAERLPRATYANLDRAAHAIQIEQGDLVRAHLREWLARVREGLGDSYGDPSREP
jgi:pimeloyl-ACP methyl ester carboxylesterase